MSLLHWNYFLALEQDVLKVSRYIELTEDNFGTYSTENARILMTATQEVDVLAKQICQHFGDDSDSEGGYREFIPKKFPEISSLTVALPRFGLECQPYVNWASKKTPDWWTANNKVKHERHREFARASVSNVLNAICALFLMNLYYHDSISKLDEIFPGPVLLAAVQLTESMVPTVMGLCPKFRMPPRRIIT